VHRDYTDPPVALLCPCRVRGGSDARPRRPADHSAAVATFRAFDALAGDFPVAFDAARAFIANRWATLNAFSWAGHRSGPHEPFSVAVLLQPSLRHGSTSPAFRAARVALALDSAATPYVDMLAALKQHDEQVAAGAAPKLSPEAVADERTNAAEQAMAAIDAGIDNIDGTAVNNIRRLKYLRDTDADAGTPAAESRRVADLLQVQSLTTRPGADPMELARQGLAVVDMDPRTATIMLNASMQIGVLNQEDAVPYLMIRGELQRRIDDVRNTTEPHRVALTEKIATARRMAIDNRLQLLRLKEQVLTAAGSEEAVPASLNRKLAEWSRAKLYGIAYVESPAVDATGVGISGRGTAMPRIRSASNTAPGFNRRGNR
jgi:hypothetical protein